MATTNARITARKGVLSSLPILLPGELGLATDHQRLFIGQEPITGVCDITASTNTTAKVEFTSANGDVIDMDLMAPLDNYSYSIKINPDTDNIDILASNITFTDSKASFPHGLVDTGGSIRLPTNSDVFVLYYNKEVGYHAEAFPNPLQEVSFTATASGVAQTTGIEFLCENKESVIIEYTLKPANGPSRRGILSILLDHDDTTKAPTTSSIKDEYDIGVVQSGSFILGKEYNIATVGTTDFTLIGSANNNVGTKFTATGTGTGTEKATLVETPLSFSLTHNSVDKFILNFKTTDTVNAHTFTYVQKSFK